MPAIGVVDRIDGDSVCDMADKLGIVLEPIGTSMLPITRNTPAEIAACPIRQVFIKATGRWHILIFLALEDGPLRFSQVKRTIGEVTQRVLTENLRKLERDGYLTRTVRSGPPLAVFYELTPLGISFVAALKPAILWSRDNFTEIKAARSEFDEKLQ